MIFSEHESDDPKTGTRVKVTAKQCDRLYWGALPMFAATPHSP
jgi:hypothetical protein